MKRKIDLLILFSVIATLVLSSCTTATQTPTMEATEEIEVTEVPEETAEAVETGRFTIRAEESIQAVVSELYGVFFPDELPVFVEADADLLVRTAPEDETFTMESLPATFLPDWQMLPQSGNADAADFIEFAVSPEGQQVLIDLGELPSTITLTDQAGNTVEYPQPITRAISAYGPATAMVYGVGAADQLVSAAYLGAKGDGATVMESIDPRFPELQTSSFSQSEFNLEEAATFNPDLIIASARSTWLESGGELGVPMFLYDAETPEALKEAILLTGQLFGPNTAAQAEAWVAYYEWIEASVLEQTDILTEEDQITVLFTGTSPLRVVSSDMIQTSLIQIAGGISVSWELTGYWNDVNLEQVAEWNPDLILVPPYGGATTEAITEDAEWQILDAVQNGMVFQMPKLVAPWDTPTPDTVLALIWLAERFYPDLDTPDCSEQVQYFYNTFYDFDISADQIDLLCAIN